jgi:uncharacterized protein with von Willebrand factor type A (vWA) domain
VFLAFFYTLRGHGIPVTPKEWLGVCEVLLRHPEPTLDLLYHVARSVCVKHETLYDAYDRAFSEAFDLPVRPGAQSSPVELFLKAMAEGSPDALAKLGFDIPPELAALLMQNREQLAELVNDSPVEVPDGIRFDEDGERKQSARRVAVQRRFKNYRTDVTLDTRTLRVALSRLRRMLPEGPRDQLNLEETIKQSGRNAGEIELIFQRRKKNRVKLVLMMDAGGTMTPYAGLVSRLFSAAKSQFTDMRAYYFHNCVYQQVYSDIERRQAVPTQEVLQYGEDHWLIMVGDAHMGGMELIGVRRAIEGPPNDEPGMVWLQRLKERFVSSVWLNPLQQASSLSSNHSVMLVQSIFPMYGLTVEGIEQAMRHLMQKRPV